MRKVQITVIVISIITTLLSGCLFIKPTYTKEKIVETITNLCEVEYSIKPKVWLLGETVWVYMPLPKLITKDVQFDKDVFEKINKVMIGASRVLLSMKPRPQFMALVASDTEEYGIDYTVITWIPDIVKYQLQFVSRDEFFRRNIIRVEESPAALGDREGVHLKKEDIKLSEFLGEQIKQRIQLKFNLDPGLKEAFKSEDVRVVFDKDIFKITCNIKLVKVFPKTPMNTQDEIAKIAAYTIQQYDFKDFLMVEIENAATGEKTDLSRIALKDFL